MTPEGWHGMRNQWFAIRVKPRSEKLVATMAHNKGFEDFLPLYECRRRWTDRIKSVELPLFPGYVFCRLAPEKRLPLLTIPGVLHFVGAGRIPAPIEDSEIEAIRSAIQAGLPTEPWPFVTAGQRVRLRYGPLAGLEGVVTKVRNEHRLIVSLSLLRRSVAVEIEREWVTPLHSGREGGPIPKDIPDHSRYVLPRPVAMRPEARGPAPAATRTGETAYSPA